MPSLAEVLDGIASAALLTGSDRRMCLRQAVLAALQVTVVPPVDEVIIGEATDLQQAIERTEGRAFGSPGRAFAAVRARLPEHLRIRAQRLVRGRNRAAHPPRCDPALVGEVLCELAAAGARDSSPEDTHTGGQPGVPCNPAARSGRMGPRTRPRTGSDAESSLSDVAVHTPTGNLRQPMDDPDLSDITFVVEGKRLYAQKAFLVEQCEHFHKMLSCERFVESHTNEIEIPQWSFTAFAAMLEWLHSGHAPRELSAAHLMEVLGLADHFVLDGLKHVCAHLLGRSAGIDNVCILLRLADQFMVHDLKRTCLSFIQQNLDQVAPTKSFGLPRVAAGGDA